MVKSFKILSAVFFVIISTCNSLTSQTDLRKPLNVESMRQREEFVKKYAPSDSAFIALQSIANTFALKRQYAIVSEVYRFYKPLFPQYDSIFTKNIKFYETIMLALTPTPNQFGIYDRYIKSNPPNEDALAAVQRITEHYINRRLWDSAISILKNYEPLFPVKSEYFQRLIGILQAPEEKVTINNVSRTINTQKDEWDPNPTPDGKYIYFTSRDKSGGFGSSDVWVSELRNNQWSEPENLGQVINSKRDETVDNVSTDGNTLLLSGTFAGTFGNFDIYIAQKTPEGWGNLQHLPAPVNSEYNDEGACFSPDGNAILFTSDRPGGTGSFKKLGEINSGRSWGNIDIYVCFKTDNGWSEPINLGTKINTPYAERAPFLHPDGKTLYFASDGHPGLGRLDMFKSVRLREDSWTEWSEPVNLGKQINSISDDWGYKVSLSGDSAFFAANSRADGAGGWDIFTVNLPQIAKPETVITVMGVVKSSDGKPLEADVKWEDLANGQIIGSLKSNPIDGTYFIALNPGKFYGYYAVKQGYYPASENIDLRNYKSNHNVVKDIILTQNKEFEKSKEKIIVKNIFFDFDNFVLKQESYPELNRLAAYLENFPDRKVIIEGHTDSTGSKEYNLELSKNRAESVKFFLLNAGCENERIIVKGMGMEKPISDNQSDDGKAKNRRVEIWLSDE